MSDGRAGLGWGGAGTGRLVIMGSGETAPTMIKIHRMLLQTVPEGSAVVLDTPYGFQENADEITTRAQHYFRNSVGREVRPAHWRGADVDGLARERALAAVRSADWVFSGPGSPTYALRAWRDSALPGLLRETVSAGGTVVFASAAALTLGSHSVPVYEIYKAGIVPYWENGLDLVADVTGLPAVVIPHYDNAEGGHHDTRFCYLGERRLAALETALPENAFVLGVDEHTAVVLDVGEGTASVLGNGGATIRRRGHSSIHPAGTVLGLDEFGSVSAGSLHNLLSAGLQSGGLAANRLNGGAPASTSLPDDAGSTRTDHGDSSQPEDISQPGDSSRPEDIGTVSLRAAADACLGQFTSAVQGRNVDAAVAAILNLDQAITDWSSDTLSSDDGDHARGILRSMVVGLGDLARKGVRDPVDMIRPFVDLLVSLRGAAREDKDFAASDRIRDLLTSQSVELRDTASGPTWSLTGDPPPD